MLFRNQKIGNISLLFDGEVQPVYTLNTSLSPRQTLAANVESFEHVLRLFGWTLTSLHPGCRQFCRAHAGSECLFYK